MASLFNISSRYADIIEKIDSFASWEPDTDADGNFITPDGEVIDEAQNRFGFRTIRFD